MGALWPNEFQLRANGTDSCCTFASHAGGREFESPSLHQENLSESQDFERFFCLHNFFNMVVIWSQPLLSESSIFVGVQLRHLLMQLADVSLDINVTGDVKICVAKNLRQGIVIDPQTMPARGQRIAAAVRVHSALRSADAQTFQRRIIVALSEVVSVDIPIISGKE